MAGRYARELREFGRTYSYARDAPIDALLHFVEAAVHTPLYAVSSDGSMTACVLASALHRFAGFMAKPVRPMEFLESRIEYNESVLVTSAAGDDGDILHVCNRVALTDPANLGILCTSTDNIMTRRMDDLRIHICANDIPAKKDGFLSTNSLLAMSVWLIRAYVHARGTGVRLPHNLDDLLCTGAAEGDFEASLEARLEPLMGRPTIIVLYDVMGMAAAADIESKLVNAGLANVHLSDYHSFAHGTYNWIVRNPGSTGVIALLHPVRENLPAMRVAQRIPDGVPIVEIRTEQQGPAGMLNLLVQVMYAVRMFGDFWGIDPGRPGAAMGMAAALDRKQAGPQ